MVRDLLLQVAVVAVQGEPMDVQAVRLTVDKVVKRVLRVPTQPDTAVAAVAAV